MQHRSSSGRHTEHAGNQTNWWVASRPHRPIPGEGQLELNRQNRNIIRKQDYTMLTINIPQASLAPGSQRSSVLGHNELSRSEHYIHEILKPRLHQPPAAQLRQCPGLDAGTPLAPS